MSRKFTGSFQATGKLRQSRRKVSFASRILEVLKIAEIKITFKCAAETHDMSLHDHGSE